MYGSPYICLPFLFSIKPYCFLFFLIRIQSMTVLLSYKDMFLKAWWFFSARDRDVKLNAR